MPALVHGSGAKHGKHQKKIMIYNGFPIKTQCAECGEKIVFPDMAKQFRPCPKCGDCLSIVHDDYKISVRMWLMVSALLSYPFINYFLVVMVFSLIIYLGLVFSGYLSTYQTSKVSGKYCAVNENDA